MKSYNNTSKWVAFSAISTVLAATQAFGFGSNAHTDLGPATTTKQVRHARPASAAVPAKTPAQPARVQPSTKAPAGIPQWAKPGECYAQVIVPAQYQTVTEKVLVKEASGRIEIVPAQYETAEVRVMTKAASKRLEIVPAEYTTVKEKIMVTPASSRIIEVPAEYGYKEEKVLVNPARTVWKKGENPLGKIDHKTGEIVCLVNLPAEYKTVKKQVVTKPATTRVEEIPATFEYVEKVVESKPATTRVIEIPAEYETRKIQKLVKPETKRMVPIPAEYKTITRQVKSAASQTEWRRILCETNVTSEVIYSIQKALKAQGFDPGAPDGVYGTQTKMALENFQSKKNLPKGSLNYETLRALGISI